MNRWFAVGVLAGAMLATASCSSSSPLPATGVLSLDIVFAAPAPGRPLSIGGYAAFGRLNAADGDQVWAGELKPWSRSGEPRPLSQLVELPAGEYGLEMSVRPASDAITVDQNGNVHRDFGPVTATCSTTVLISPPDISAVLVAVVGGDSCSIGPAE